MWVWKVYKCVYIHIYMCIYVPIHRYVRNIYDTHMICMFIYVPVRIYVSIYTQIYVYIHLCIYTPMYVYKFVYTYISYIYTYTNMHSDIHRIILILTGLSLSIYAYMSRIHTHICTNTHISSIPKKKCTHAYILSDLFDVIWIDTPKSYKSNCRRLLEQQVYLNI